MRRIIRYAFMIILVIGVAGTGYWGYQEHQDKNSILIKAENNYQRAFHNLNNHISNIEDELGKSIAMNSRNLLAPCMTTIWRLAYSAQSEVGQLPLTMVAFSKTEKFLAQIADYTYGIGMRDLDKEPINDKEWNQLKTLHKQAKEIQGELRKIQTQVLDKNIRWMDVELAIASEEVDFAKPIIAGIQAIDKQVEGYDETEFGPTDNKFSEKLGDKRKLIKGKRVNEEQVREKVQRFLKIKNDTPMEIEREGKGQEFTAYSVNIKPPDRKNHISLEVTQKGGHVVWMLDSRDIEKTKLGLNDAQTIALKFLKERGITSMESVQSDQYDNVGVFEFVYVQNNVRFFTDLIRVKVALDNGDIIGYESLDYIIAHQEKRRIPKVKVSLAQAKAKLNRNLKIMEDHLSMVEFKAGEVKLCYELYGTIDDETYRIFINAVTGDEERIEKLKQAEPMV